MVTVLLKYIDHLLQFCINIAIYVFYISYYAGIMLNNFNDPLCSKLCWHNRRVPVRDQQHHIIWLQSEHEVTLQNNQFLWSKSEWLLYIKT